ncbi:MAG: hypothetical protein AB7P21_06680 [Lautropia sp.]
MTRAAAAMRARRRLCRSLAVLAGAGAGAVAGAVAGAAPGRAAATAGTDDGDAAFWFGLLGDSPYGALDALSFERVLAATAREGLQCLIHVGDIKSSAEACSDALLAARIALLDAAPHPLFYTPGDNEWTDCHAGADPLAPGNRLDRLEWLRRHVFSTDVSLGRRRRPLERQAKRFDGGAALPENLRWRIGSLQFCTLHVVGSGNGLRRRGEIPRSAALAEWRVRQAANARWLTDTAALARRSGALGLAIALHANMRFEQDDDDGWRAMREVVVATARDWGGPVLLMHGDTHHFRADRLLARSHGLPRLLRVESFGFPFASSWVQIRWNPQAIDDADGPFLVSTRSL